jgi:hypothetical protein
MEAVKSVKTQMVGRRDTSVFIKIQNQTPSHSAEERYGQSFSKTCPLALDNPPIRHEQRAVLRDYIPPYFVMHEQCDSTSRLCFQVGVQHDALAVSSPPALPTRRRFPQHPTSHMFNGQNSPHAVRAIRHNFTAFRLASLSSHTCSKSLEEERRI